MHDDESMVTSRPPAEGAHSDIRLPPPLWAKSAATPGGVPPMFAAGAHAESPAMRGDALEH